MVTGTTLQCTLTIHRHNQEFLRGCTFPPRKKVDLFLSRRPQNRLKLLNYPLPPSRSLQFCLGKACTIYHLQLSSVNLAPNFFIRPGGAPPGYACHNTLHKLHVIKSSVNKPAGENPKTTTVITRKYFAILLSRDDHLRSRPLPLVKYMQPSTVRVKKVAS